MHATTLTHPRWVAATLGATQTVAWASSFYLPSVLAHVIGSDLGLAQAWVFGALSSGLGVSGLLAPRVGHLIDRFGGRPVLCGSNLLFAVGLAVLAAATGPVVLFCSWSVIGLGMGAGLYEPAFAALARLYGRNARGAITGVTLIAGFASTVGWPISAYLEHRLGWRGACICWSLAHVLVALPLNAWTLRGPLHAIDVETGPPLVRVRFSDDPRLLRLAFMFTASGIVSTGVAASMPSLLRASGIGSTEAIAAASLMGPAQVAARVLEYGARRWIDPLVSARVANSLHPLGATVLLAFGAPSSAIFAVAHGAGNGILTIAKGTLPLAIFGANGYGARVGLLLHRLAWDRHWHRFYSVWRSSDLG